MQYIPPSNVTDGTIEVAGLVDIDTKALEKGRTHLGLPEQCFTLAQEAFRTVIPPALHESIVDLALARGMHILSEKPIADTMEASVRIADKVKAAGRKMAVTMSHFDQDTKGGSSVGTHSDVPIRYHVDTPVTTACTVPGGVFATKWPTLR